MWIDISPQNIKIFEYFDKILWFYEHIIPFVSSSISSTKHHKIWVIIRKVAIKYAFSFWPFSWVLDLESFFLYMILFLCAWDKMWDNLGQRPSTFIACPKIQYIYVLSVECSTCVVSTTFEIKHKFKIPI